MKARKADGVGGFVVGGVAGALFVALLHAGLPLEPAPVFAEGDICRAATRLTASGQRETAIGAFLLGREFALYPLSLQNAMWVFFFAGLGALWRRAQWARLERAECAAGLLPEDKETVLTQDKLPAIYRAFGGRRGDLFLPRVVRRAILQFQASHSFDSSNALLNSSAELFMHELELRYNFLRYVMWLIPTLGFIGTVMGIAYALSYAGGAGVAECANFVSQLTRKMAVAFNTTLLALLQAAVLVFLFHVAQGREERALNDSVQYCLDNLINRLYEDKGRAQ